MKPQKALSIKQPYASLIALGIKDIENRTWKTNFRGRIYIHASGIFDKTFDDRLSGAMYQEYHKQTRLYLNKQSISYDYRIVEFYHEQPKSAIIGEVDIIDCIINHNSIWAEESNIDLCDTKTTYNWVLANPVMYDKPILNVKGKLSFWNFYPLKP